jgi:basic membrane protein A
MKSKILLLLLIPVILLASCAKKAEPKAMAKAFTVGLVTDVGGIDDKSFNQGTWEGVKAFADEMKLSVDKDVKYLQSTAEADYLPNLSAFADQKMDLIVAPGFLFNSAMLEAATKYPNQKFLIIDSVVADKDGKNIANVANAVFAANEGSFLAGAAAGLKAKADGKKVVGYVGGMEFPLIQSFQAGFEQGVAAVFPECKILVDYVGNFTDAGKGQALAAKQFGAGAYVIFQVAGGAGNGVIKEAKERQAKADVRWAIGVDKDQYNDGVFADGKSAVLTSMMKRVDNAAKDVATLAMNGKFPGGTVTVYSLANNGVGLPATNPNLSDDIVKQVQGYADQIKAGTLKVAEMPTKK